MTTAETIREAVDLLAADPLPKQIILFGSQARGDSDAGSDIDLLVIEPAVSDRGAEMVRLRQLLRPLAAAFDVLVYSRDEVARWGGQPGTALYWALKEGKVLHDR
jgi:predicted nucleotidyltransferase